MDNKEIKQELKAARESIRNKSYKDALKHCKNVLKHDKTNYNALVFVGVAAEGMEQPDQALAAYKRAIESDPEQILAWQGLCGFYEKSGKDEHRPDMVPVYEKLIQLLDSDKTRKAEMSLKLAQLQQSLGNTDKAVELYQQMLEFTTEETRQDVCLKLASLLQQLKNRSPDHTKLLDECYKAVLHSKQEPDEETQQTWIQYITFLLQNGSAVDRVEEECQLMSEKYPDCPFPLETQCQLYLDGSIVLESATEDISAVVDRLEALNAESGYIKLVPSYHKLQARDFMAAKQLAKEGLASTTDSVSGNVLLVNCYLGLHDSQAIMNTADKILKTLEKKKLHSAEFKAAARRKLQLFKAQALVNIGHSKSFEECVEICTKLQEEDYKMAEVLFHISLAYLGLGDWDNAAEMIKKLTSIESSARVIALQAWSQLLQADLDNAEISLEKAVAMGDADALCCHWLGRLYWAKSANNKDYRNKGFKTLLEAAKRDPFYSDNFLYLGHYYQEVLQDQGKAKRCYQKAYDLNKDSEESGAALVDALVAAGEENAAFNLLVSVTSQASAGSAKWAWLRLGLQQLNQDDPSKAITSLQAALRADPKDNHCWECLGEAYMSRGSYSAALKAYTRATELDPNAMYCFYQIASVKQTLGLYTEAVEEYLGILKTSPSYIPALKGLGEALVHLAGGAVVKFFHGRAVSYCQEAITYLTRAVSGRPDLSCLWKLLGDACTCVFPVPEEECRLEIPSKLLSLNNTNDSSVSLSKTELIALGARCYGMALKQLPECASLWHDLGANYFNQSQLATNSSFGKQLATKAIQCVQKAVTMDPLNYRHWNALGVIAASKEIDHPGLAQHSFIKSAQCESNNVAAWTNLGTLYLKNDQIELAHEAFKTAQSVDPGYVACWIGQALIAETVGHADAMDLFRHTTELGNNVEGSIGYANWVCSTLRDKAKKDSVMFRYSIEQMAAIPAACDALDRYTSRIKTNPTAYNMHGLLLEKQKLYKRATEALKRCVELLEKSGPQEHLEAARANYARLLCYSGCHVESVKQYGIMGDLNTLEDICGLALAKYNLGHFQESLQAYEKALSVASSEEDKSHIQAIMGMVAYRCGNIDGAKTALFQCAQSSAPSVVGLQALCSIGLLQGDATLATAALQELYKVQNNDSESQSVHIAFLTATLHVTQGKREAGRNDLLKLVHMHPNWASAWQSVSLYLFRYLPEYSLMTVRCAQVAEQVARHSNQVLTNLISLGSCGAGLHSRKDPNNNTFSQAQKAVHLYPDGVTHWFSLLAAALAEHVVRFVRHQEQKKLKEVTLTLTAHLMSKVETELQHGEGNKARLRELHLWCIKEYVITMFSLGRTDQAKQFLEQAVWLYDNDPILRSLSASLDQNFKGLRNLAQESNSPYVWKVLVWTLLQQGLVNEVTKTLRAYADSLSGTEKLVVLNQLAHLSYTEIMNGSEENPKWRTVFDECVLEALKIDSHDCAVNLMQGVLALKDKNKKLAKKSLQRALSDTKPGALPEAQSMVRQHLLGVYRDLQDTEAIQDLAARAFAVEDEEFETFFKQVNNNEETQ